MLDLHAYASRPADLRDFLIARGVIRNEDGQLVGALPGVEITWGALPNPIMTDVGNPDADPPVPPTYRSEKIYLIRLAHQAAEDDDSGDVVEPDDPAPHFTRSKVAKWIRNNATPVTVNSANGKSYRVFAMFGITATFGFVHPADTGDFGTWQ
jgi:hypothetical protein